MPKPVFYGFTEDIDIGEKFPLRTFKFVDDPLSREERQLLEKHWAKLVALIEGNMVSSDRRDQHFVTVFKEKKGEQPTTKLELAWLKYRVAREEEDRLKALWLEKRKKSPEYKEYLKSRF